MKFKQFNQEMIKKGWHEIPTFDENIFQYSMYFFQMTFSQTISKSLIENSDIELVKFLTNKAVNDLALKAYGIKI